MDTKLTLKLDDYIIEKAKTYAKQKQTSLSKLIEAYLNFLTSTPSDKDDITPLVKSLSGIIDLPKKIDYKKEYKQHIANKYSK